jgi:hypothetical protein
LSFGEKDLDNRPELVEIFDYLESYSDIDGVLILKNFSAGKFPKYYLKQGAWPRLAEDGMLLRTTALSSDKKKSFPHR